MQKFLQKLSTAPAPLVASLLTALISILPILFGQRYSGLDLIRTEIPRLCELKNFIETKQWPWVSTYFGNGEPLYAHFESTIFYPFRLIALLFSPELGASLAVVLQLSAAAACGTLLMQTFSLARRQAVIAGVCYAMSGTVLDLIRHSMYLSGAPGLALSWAGIRILIQNPKAPLSFKFWTLGLMTLILGGDPQSFLIAHIIALVELLTSLEKNSLHSLVPRFLRTSTGSLFAIALTAAYWLPVWGELRVGNHLSGLETQRILAWSFDPPGWLATVWPGILSNSIRDISNIWSVFLSKENSDPPLLPLTWNLSPFLGWVCVASLMFSIREKIYRSAMILGGLFLIFSLGYWTPIFPALLTVIKPLMLFRYPSKYLLVTTLACMVLAAGGAQKISSSKSSLKTFQFILGVITSITLLICILISAFSEPLNQWASHISEKWSSHGEITALLPSLSESLQTSVTQSILMSVLFLTALFAFKKTSPQKWIMAFVLAELFIAAIASTHLSVPVIDTAMESPLQSITALSKNPQDPPVFCHSEELSRRAMSSWTDNPWDLSMFFKIVALPNLNACEKIISASPYSAVTTPARALIQTGVNLGRLPAIQSLGCTHYVSEKDLPTQDAEEIPLMGFESLGTGERRLKAWKLKNPTPTVFVSESPVLAPNQMALFEMLIRNHEGRKVTSYVDDPLRKLTSTEELPTGQDLQIHRILWENPSLAWVEIAGQGGGVIGLRKTFATGWRIFRGDQELTPLRISGALLGARIPPGAGPTLIRFQYFPPFLMQGLAISAAGFAVFAFLFFWGRRKCFLPRESSHNP